MIAKIMKTLLMFIALSIDFMANAQPGPRPGGGGGGGSSTNVLQAGDNIGIVTNSSGNWTVYLKTNPAITQPRALISSFSSGNANLTLFTNGSGWASAIGPFTGPFNGGVTIYATNGGGDKTGPLTSVMDVTSTNILANQPFTLTTGQFTGNGAGLTNLSQSALPATVTTNNGTLTLNQVQVGNGGRGVGNAANSGPVLSLFPSDILTNGYTANIAIGGGLTNNSAAGYNGNGAGLTNLQGGSVVLPISNQIPSSGYAVYLIPRGTNSASGTSPATFSQTTGTVGTNTEIIWNRGWNVGFNGAVIDTNFLALQEVVEMNWDPLNPSTQRQIEYYMNYNARSNTFGNRPFALTLRDAGNLQSDFSVDVFHLDGPAANNDSAVVWNVSRSSGGGANETLNGALTVTNNNVANGSIQINGSGGFTIADGKNTTGNFNILYDGAVPGYKMYGNTNLAFSQFPNVAFAGVPVDFNNHVRIGFASGTAAGDLLTYNGTDIVLGGTSVAGSGNFTSIRGNNGNDTILSRAFTAFQWYDTHSGSSGQLGTKRMDLNAATGNLVLGGNLSATNGANFGSTYQTAIDASGNVTNSGLHQMASGRITNPTNSATVVNLGLDANGNVSTNALPIGSPVFNNTQFGSAGGTTNIISAAFVTNLVNSGTVALTDGATIATDASLGTVFRVTLGGNRTLSNPTNPRNGERLMWEIIQDGTGNRTLTMDTKFAFGTDITGITLTTNASKRDFITAYYNSTADLWYVVGFVRGY